MANNKRKKGTRIKNTEHPTDSTPIISSGEGEKAKVLSITKKQMEVLELVKQELRFRQIVKTIKKAPSSIHDRMKQLIRKGLVRNSGGTYRLTDSGKIATCVRSGGCKVVQEKNMHSNGFEVDIKRLPNHWYSYKPYFESLKIKDFLISEESRQVHLIFEECRIIIYETKLKAMFWITKRTGKSFDQIKMSCFDCFVKYYDMLKIHGFSFDNRIRSPDPHFADPTGFFAKLASYTNSDSFRIDTKRGSFWVDFSQGDYIPEEETDNETVAKRMEQLSKTAMESDSDFKTIDKLVEWAKYQSMTTHNMISNCQGVQTQPIKTQKGVPNYIG